MCRDARGGTLVECLVLVGAVALGVLAGVRVYGRAVHDKVESQARCVQSLDCEPGGASQADGPPLEHWERWATNNAAANVSSSTERHSSTAPIAHPNTPVDDNPDP